MPDNIELNQPSGYPLLTLTQRMRDRSERNVLDDPIIVEDVVAAVLDTMEGRLSPTEAHLLQEIAGLGRIIDHAKAEIAEVKVDSIRGRDIPSATGELDAIVEHTALATTSILESCEALDKLGETLDSAQATILQNAVTQIYEACSFQDITGQRITKIVKALKAIEQKVVELSGAGALEADAASRPHDPAPSGDFCLLNGPALPHEAMDQDDIDKLLGDF
ncbi:MAG TPA: protein phosphatase CheZ [Rhodopila sp.]|jgi:chemotaxis protein CheZ|nr:protein phosphatase CheZ [Rhodopila sp.]